MPCSGLTTRAFQNADSFVDEFTLRRVPSPLHFSLYHRRLRESQSTQAGGAPPAAALPATRRPISSGNGWGRGSDANNEPRPWRTSWIPIDRPPVNTFGPERRVGNSPEALPSPAPQTPEATTEATRRKRPTSAWRDGPELGSLRARGPAFRSGLTTRPIDSDLGSQEWGLLNRRDPRGSRPWQDASLSRRERAVEGKVDLQQKPSSQNAGFWPSARTHIAGLGSKQVARSHNLPGTSWLDFEKRGDFEKSRPSRPLGDSDGWAWAGKEKSETTRRHEDAASPRRGDRAMPTDEDSGTRRARASQSPTAPQRWDASRRQHQRARPIKPQGKPKPRWRSSSGSDEENDYDYDDTAERLAEDRRRRKQERRQQQEKGLVQGGNQLTPILVPQLISVANLGHALGMKPAVFLEGLAELGFGEITQESIMTGETAALVAQEYGFEPTVDDGDLVDLKARPPAADPTALPPRPPIVTIMGHVDHGKTTMLDWLRKSSVAAQEHGGITQHIGAFPVRLSTGKQITFLDTPGHAAFLNMRQRGANVTDIVVLVVAADDSVKSQTLEALKHARQAKVPVIIAINKIDKDEARVEQVKMDLARHGVELEEHGGDVQVVCVSGKTGKGMEDLEESILTLSEILDVRAEPDGMAEGWILESTVKPVGRVATVLVKRGTLRTGDCVVAGTAWARIRRLRDAAGTDVDEATAGMPVEVLGWKDAPDAGDEVIQAPSEGRARAAASYRFDMKIRNRAASDMAAQEKQRREKADLEAVEQQDRSYADVPPGEVNGTKTLNFVIKGDVMGSVEAVGAAVMEIGNNEVRLRSYTPR